MASVAERLERLSIPEPNSGCWLWLGSINAQGYGQIMMRNQRKMKAHRVSFETYNGSIPDGLHVLHRCDLPGCINPEHLFCGTVSDNMRDMYTKRRHPKVRLLGVLHPGAKLTENQVREIIASPKRTRGLAKRFGVSNSRISAIRKGLNWSHINEER
jgi:hypothetical protein